MTVKDRIKQFCKAENLTISAFEASIGVSNGYVNAISRSIGIDRLNTIIEIYSNLNIEWLLSGRGCMYKEVSITTTEQIPTYKKQEHEVADNSSLISIIQEQAEEIGRLKECIRQLTVEKEKHVSPADIDSTANVG